MVGRTISHYKVLSEVGRGGMGVVHKAEDTNLKRPVALKFLAAHLLGDKEAKARFRREAEAAAALNHPTSGSSNVSLRKNEGRPRGNQCEQRRGKSRTTSGAGS